MTKILMVAGGTGGHVFPAAAVAEQLEKKGYEVHFITDIRGAQYLSDHYSKSVYNLSRLGRRTWLTTPLAIWQMFILTFSCFIFFLRSRPGRVVGFGGYVSYPVLQMARIFRVPYYIHEQNSVMGRVNRGFVKGAKGVMTSFPKTAYANENAIFTGLPVRQDLLLARESPPYQAPIDRFNILVLGGSQGASIFSTVVPEAIGLLPPELRHRLNIVQQCRKGDLEKVTQQYQALDVKARLAPFFEHMSMELSHSHLVITRAGASTVAELSVIGRPAIFVPYAAAKDDHQTFNADYAVSVNAGWLFTEKEFTAAALADKLEYLWKNTAFLTDGANLMKALGKCTAAEEIAQVIVS